MVREPASVPTVRTGFEFELDRTIQVVLQEKSRLRPFLNLHYFGRVFTVSNEGKGSWGYELHFDGMDGIRRSNLPIRIEVLNGTLTRFTAPVPLTQEETDELNVWKDIASILAYRCGEDTTGEYDCAWNEQDFSGRKTKRAYRGAIGKTVRIVSSAHESRWDQEGHPFLLVGRDELKMNGGSGSGMDSVSTYRLMRKAEVKAPKAYASTLREVIPQRVRIEHSHSLEGLNERLTLLLKDDFKSFDSQPSIRLRHFHEWLKGLRLLPSRVQEFRNYIEAAAVLHSSAMEFGIGVLAGCGGAGADRILMDWFHSDTSDSRRKHLILNAIASNSAKPGPELQEFLRGLSRSDDQDLALNAALAIGAGLRREADGPGAERLIEMYRSAQSPELRAVLLDSFGNSGNSQFLPFLLQSLQEDELRLREKAAYASRFMDGESALQLVSKAVLDPAPSVRQAAIRSLWFQKDLTRFAPVIKTCAGSGNQDCLNLIQKIEESQDSSVS
jgi:hypothetical protein